MEPPSTPERFSAARWQEQIYWGSLEMLGELHLCLPGLGLAQKGSGIFECCYQAPNTEIREKNNHPAGCNLVKY